MLVPFGLVAGYVAEIARLLAGVVRSLTLSFSVGRYCVV